MCVYILVVLGCVAIFWAIFYGNNCNLVRFQENSPRVDLSNRPEHPNHWNPASWVVAWVLKKRRTKMHEWYGARGKVAWFPCSIMMEHSSGKKRYTKIAAQVKIIAVPTPAWYKHFMFDFMFADFMFDSELTIKHGMRLTFFHLCRLRPSPRDVRQSGPMALVKSSSFNEVTLTS